jgi:uncharacterized membrane protein
MGFTSYITGPQLIGAIFFIVGVIMKYFPPKHINSSYGYRTNSSMKNQDTWDEANSYSARLMIIIGIGLFVFGITLTILMNALLIPAKTQGVILAATTIILTISTAILLLVITERHLKKTFNKKDEVR